MNTTNLIEKVAKVNKIPKILSEKVVKSIFTSIFEVVKSGKVVQISKFGTFSRAKRKARNGRNPQTGAAIKIAASKYPKFKAGSAFKSAVK